MEQLESPQIDFWRMARAEEKRINRRKKEATFGESQRQSDRAVAFELPNRFWRDPRRVLYRTHGRMSFHRPITAGVSRYRESSNLEARHEMNPKSASLTLSTSWRELQYHAPDHVHERELMIIESHGVGSQIGTLNLLHSPPRRDSRLFETSYLYLATPADHL